MCCKYVIGIKNVNRIVLDKFICSQSFYEHQAEQRELDLLGETNSSAAIATIQEQQKVQEQAVFSTDHNVALANAVVTRPASVPLAPAQIATAQAVSKPATDTQDVDALIKSAQNLLALKRAKFGTSSLMETDSDIELLTT